MSQSQLRKHVVRMDREVLAISGRDGADTSALAEAWVGLVHELALGPEPELRACPKCRQLGMRDATRCGHCWEALDPPTAGH